MRKSLLFLSVLSAGTIFSQISASANLTVKGVEKLKNTTSYIQSKSTSDFVPGYREIYYHNGTSFELSGRNDYTYVHSDRLSLDSFSIWDGATYNPTSRTLYEYSPTYRAQIFEYWDFGTSDWEPTYADTTYIDANFNTTKQVSYTYNQVTSEWELTWGNISDITYNGANQVEQITYYDIFANGDLEPTYRENWTWTAGANGPTEGYFYLWDDVAEEWVVDNRSLNIVWFDYSAGKVAEATIEEFDGTNWENFIKVIGTFYPNGILESRINLAWDGTQWVNFFYVNQSIDANGLVTEAYESDWDDIEEEWVINNGFEFDNIYGPDDELIEQIHHYHNGTDINPEVRYVFGDHLNIASLDDINLSQVNIFPNPASEFVTIDNQGAESGIYSVYSVTGERVLTGDLTNEKTVLNVSGIAPGIYTVQVLSQNSTISRKLIKQ